jgi:hypothetical protein
MFLFIRGSAHSAFLRAGPRAPAPLSSHSLSHRQSGPVHQPRRCATAGTRLGRRPTVRARPHAARTPCGISAVGPPPPLYCPLPPLKNSHRPIFFSLARRSSRPSTPEHRTRFPHGPGVRLAGFPPPEPLLRVELCPSIAVVHPFR